MSDSPAGKMPESFNQFVDVDIVRFNRLIVAMLDAEQFQHGENLAMQLLKHIQGEQRGPALFSLLLVAQIICEQWRDERAQQHGNTSKEDLKFLM
ncbi:MAG: hypothetical protein KGJ13_07980 [Patescibacteria group bacterium]|nr:hypothetical protein [Patescibacteria group bacterium]